MRLWSIHPSYLDTKGLVGLWREVILAQKVLCGETSAYSRHPQIEGFRQSPDPQAAIAAYLIGIWEEGHRRGYRFNKDRIRKSRESVAIPVTKGQLEFERKWLESKLMRRCPDKVCDLPSKGARCHPVFFVVEGEKEEWEKGSLDSVPENGNLKGREGARKGKPIEHDGYLDWAPHQANARPTP